MNIVFTGTRKGMTDPQLAKVKEILKICNRPSNQLHHGACIGADRQAHPLMAIRTMYPTNPLQELWAEEHKGPNDTIVFFPHKRGVELQRNRQMVDIADIVVAAPGTMKEILRSGTWATVRYADKWDIDIHLVFPDGNYIVKEYGRINADLSPLP